MMKGCVCVCVRRGGRWLHNHVSTMTHKIVVPYHHTTLPLIPMSHTPLTPVTPTRTSHTPTLTSHTPPHTSHTPTLTSHSPSHQSHSHSHQSHSHSHQSHSPVYRHAPVTNEHSFEGRERVVVKKPIVRAVIAKILRGTLLFVRW